MDPALPDFQRAIEAPEREWDLFELALQLSCIGDPRSALVQARRQVDRLAEATLAATPPDADDYARLNAVNAVLYEENGFAGNQEDYYNPNNSFLSQVLSVRKGIPITLCLLYRRIAAAVGMDLQCVGLPGHFLLKYDKPFPPLFIDAFHSGMILLEEDCRQKLHDLYADQVEFSPQMLRAVSAREVLLRMLANLRQIYRNSGDALRLLRVLNRRILLLENPLSDVLERGVIQLDLQLYRGALDDFEYFVARVPDKQMKALILKQLPQLRILAAGN